MTPAPADLRMIDTPRGRIAALRIAATDASDRAPVVMFHDSLGSISLWRDFPKALARATGRDVIAYDRLGFGLSDARADRLRPDFVATEATGDLAAVRQAFRIGPFVALGHSVGGGMALFAAAALPQDCRAVVSISAQASNDDRVREGLRRVRAAYASPAVIARLAAYHGEKADWVLDAWLGTWLSDDFAGYDVAPALAGLRCPVLAVHGGSDEYGDVSHAQRIGAGGEVAILPGLGHFPHREDQAGVTAIIARFLEKVS